jgi:hypothetical protein
MAMLVLLADGTVVPEDQTTGPMVVPEADGMVVVLVGLVVLVDLDMFTHQHHGLQQVIHLMYLTA